VPVQRRFELEHGQVEVAHPVGVGDDLDPRDPVAVELVPEDEERPPARGRHEHGTDDRQESQTASGHEEREGAHPEDDRDEGDGVREGCDRYDSCTKPSTSHGIPVMMKSNHPWE